MPASNQPLPLDASLITPGDRLSVAISGGADSTALLLALHDRRAALGIGLSAVHIHHGLRAAEADADETFVRDLCTRLEIHLTVIPVDTPARQLTAREGLEEAARELRYAAFRNILASSAADAIATAHTLDDQAETVILKLLRGAWTEGLGAISPTLPSQPGRFIRPLLQTRRSEVEAFLTARAQPWRTDASNADLALTRNRVRHELMPLLRSFNPSADLMLSNVATLARDEQAHWDAELVRLLPQLILPGKPVRGGGRAVGTAAGEAAIAIELERLRPFSAALRRRVIRAAARSIGSRLSFEETAKILALAGFGGYDGITGRVGSRLELRAGLRAERSARELRLSRTSVTGAGYREL